MDEETNLEEKNEIVQMPVSPSVIRKYPHDIALTSVFKVLGSPHHLNIFPCDEELRVHVYEAKTISWKFWNKIKILLVKSLFREMSNGEKSEFPKYSDIRALREVLNEHFPDLLGFGKLYDQSKVGNAYHFNRKRCPNPEAYQDCIYFSLLSRLDIEKVNRRTSLSSVTNENPKAGSTTGGSGGLVKPETLSDLVTSLSQDASLESEQACDETSPNMNSSSMTRRALGASGITSQNSAWLDQMDNELKPQIEQTNTTIPDTPPRQLTSTPRITSATIKKSSITMCTPNLKELPPILTNEKPKANGMGGLPTRRSPKRLLPKDTSSDSEPLTPSPKISSVPKKINRTKNHSLKIPSTTTFTNFDDLPPALTNENPSIGECQKLKQEINETPSKRRKSTQVSFSIKRESEKG